MRIRHFKLEVGIDGDDYELGIAWSDQDGMEGTGEVRYLEGEHFHAEVGLISECHGQVDLPEGNGTKHGYDSMEWSTKWSYHRLR